MWGKGRKTRTAITTLSVRRCKECGCRLINRAFKAEGSMFVCRDCCRGGKPGGSRPGRETLDWDTISA
jgi:hypothetical protein